MTLELNRATFRRLVQLYWVSLLLAVLAIGLELISEKWRLFSERFDVLVSKNFGPSDLNDAMLLPVIIGFVAVVVWILASSIGLFWFQRWARFGTWASAVVAIITMIVVDGYRPSYSSPIWDTLTVVASGLLGAIILLAYAKDYGADWFGSAPENKQEQ